MTRPDSQLLFFEIDSFHGLQEHRIKYGPTVKKRRQLMPYKQLKSSHQTAHMVSVRKSSDGESLQIQLYSLKWSSGSLHFLKKKNLWTHELYIHKQNKHSSGQNTLAVGRG